MFEAIVLAAHLILVNIATGAPLLCIWLDWRGRRCQLSWKINRALANAAWVGLLVGGIVGLLQTALIWSPAFANALQRAGSRVMFGVVEFAFSLVLMLVYALLLARRRRVARRWQLLRMAVPFVAGTNLLYHFPALFGVLRQLAARPGETEAITSGQFRELAFQPAVIAGACHFLLASIALSAVFALVRLAGIQPLHASGEKQRLARQLAAIALVCTLLQWVVGPLVFITRSRFLQFQLTGGDVWLTGMWIQVLAVALILTALQMVLVRRPLAAGLATWVGIIMLAVIVGMGLIERSVA